MEKLTILICLFALATTPLAVRAEAGPAEVPFDRLFDTEGQPKTPSGLTWSPDGESLAYLWDDGTGDALWIERPRVQERQRVLDFPKVGKKADTPKRMLWLPDGSGLLLHRKGGLARLDLSSQPGDAAGAVRDLVATGEDDEDFKLSPDGHTVSFVRHANLWILNLASGKATRLTEDGEEGETLNGKTDWVYWEELWGRDSTGHWWSPDNQRLAFYRFDDRLVEHYPLVDFTTVPYPEITEQRYPKAGERNPTVQIGILTLPQPEEESEAASEGNGETEAEEAEEADQTGDGVVWLQTDGPEEAYLARVHWLPSGDKVAVERLNREQNRLDLLLCDPTTGACTTLLTEENDTWVRVRNFTRFLQDGSFIWASQREGWNHLYLYDKSGKLRHRLTPGGRDIASLEALNEAEGWLVYSAALTGGLEAADRRVERVPLWGDDLRVPTPLATSPGSHGATVADSSGLWVHAFHDAHTPRRLTVQDGEAKVLGALPSSDPNEALRAALPEWEFFTIPGPDGPLPARMLKPVGFNPKSKKTRYPAIVYHYGCPESQVVSNAWGTRDLWHRWMASRGYAVFMVDNGQSNHFGKAGVNRGHRRFGELNLQAQLAGVEYLKTLGWVDTDRLGLWGWSGGGANTLYVLTNAPGTFQAGVSGAPVTNWRLYDTIWTERYLDHPKDNPEGYVDSSPITYADQLRDHLLIVHGTADDNVHPQNTLAFMDRLVKADIPFEDALYPRQKHGFRGKAMNHFYRRMTAFFDRHLKDAP
jgi:dipeptidyl-peptidase 4